MSHVKINHIKHVTSEVAELSEGGGGGVDIAVLLTANFVYLTQL
jgi:hypothetical protein